MRSRCSTRPRHAGSWTPAVRAGLELTTPYGSVRAGTVILGTGAFRPLLTRDDRILWGGYDAVYSDGGRIHEEQGLGWVPPGSPLRCCWICWKNPVRNGPA